MNMGSLLQDVRYALRAMGKTPGFTAIAVIALALGIGANSAVFSICDGLIIGPLQVPNLDRIMVVWSVRPSNENEFLAVSVANYRDWQEQATSFEHMSAYRESNYTLTISGAPERVEGVALTDQFFTTFGVQAERGRLFSQDEFTDGAHRVVVLSDQFWRQRFGADSSAIGQTMLLNGAPHTIVGVAEKSFNFPAGSDFYVPFVPSPDMLTARGDGQIIVLGSLKPDVTAAQAEVEMRAIAARLAERYPRTNEGSTVAVDPLGNQIVEFGTRAFLGALMLSVGLVLMIACANIANLLLARTTDRQKELSIRLALGASRWDLARLILTETAILAMLGAGLGMVFALWILDIFQRGIPAEFVKYLPGWSAIGLNFRSLGFAVGAAVAATMLAGLAPSLLVTRSDINQSLKDEGKSTTAGPRRQRARNALVVVEIVLTLILVATSAMILKRFAELVNTNPGYNPENTLTMGISLPSDQYDETRAAAFFDRAVRDISDMSGVESAAAISRLPGDELFNPKGFEVEGRPIQNTADEAAVYQLVVQGEYFKTVQIPMLEGRAFLAEDRADSTRVGIVNESTARRFFGDESPIGKRVRFVADGDDAPWITIVGVAKDIRHHWYNERPWCVMYQPLAQSPRNSMYLALRTNAEPTQMTAGIRAHIATIDPEQPIYGVRSLKRVFDNSVAGLRIISQLMALFAVTALLLAILGIHAVLAYSVTQRRHEIGIRMALGAQPGDVLRMIAIQAMRLMIVGLAIGTPAAFGLCWLLSAVVQNAVRLEVLPFALTTSMVLVVALAASLQPARRAARVDPMTALRLD